MRKRLNYTMKSSCINKDYWVRKMKLHKIKIWMEIVIKHNHLPNLKMLSSRSLFLKFKNKKMQRQMNTKLSKKIKKLNLQISKRISNLNWRINKETNDIKFKCHTKFHLCKKITFSKKSRNKCQKYRTNKKKFHIEITRILSFTWNVSSFNGSFTSKKLFLFLAIKTNSLSIFKILFIKSFPWNKIWLFWNRTKSLIWNPFIKSSRTSIYWEPMRRLVSVNWISMEFFDWFKILPLFFFL